MNFLNLTSFLKIRHVKFSREKEEFESESTVIQGGDGLDFWAKQLSGEMPVMEWPVNRVHPPIKADRETYTFVIPQPLSEKIHSCANTCQVDPSLFLLAALRVMLYRYSGQEDLIIGNVMHLQDAVSSNASDRKTINALPLRIQLNGKHSFKDVLLHTTKVNLTANANAIPYKTILKAVNPQEDKNYPAIFQVLLHYKQVNPERVNQQDIRSTLAVNQIPIPDLIVEIANYPENLSCQVTYRSALLDSGMIKQMMNHFQNLLEAVTENDALPVGIIPLLTPDELHKQLVEFNQPQLDYRPACAHHLFEKQASLTPDAIAVRFGEQYLTYKELNTKANQ